uniref:SFRICE_028382 n=1 Tax=Spodoptera frugiperda TaxID=7108 RepID=A0A2H1W0K4_SPOFR
MLFILCVVSTLLMQTIGASPAVDNQNRAQIIRYDIETANLPNSYRFHYDNTDGSSRTEEGAILNPGTKDAALDVAGAKLFVFALFAGVLAAEEKPVAEIITESTIVNPDGYSFDFKTSDGISRHEDASLITVGDKQGIAVKGSYSYLTPEGEEYQITFTADDKGYKPTLRVVPAQQ